MEITLNLLGKYPLVLDMHEQFLLRNQDTKGFTRQCIEKFTTDTSASHPIGRFSTYAVLNFKFDDLHWFTGSAFWSEVRQ